MNIFNLFRFTLDSIIRRFGMCVIIMIVCGISLYMIDTVVTSYEQSRYNIDKIESSYRGDVNQSYYITFPELLLVNYASYQELIVQMQEIDGIGGAGTLSNDGFALVNEEKNVYYNTWIVDKDILSMGNSKLSDDMVAAMRNYSYGETIPIFVGDKLKGKFELNKIYQMETADGIQNIKVIGYLDKNASWFFRGEMFGGIGEDDNILDNSFLCVRQSFVQLNNDGGLPNYIYFTIPENEKKEQVLKQINSLAFSKDVVISIHNVGEKIAQEKAENNLSDNKTFISTVLIVIMAMVSISASTVISCLLRKKSYGIMYANGISIPDIIKMTFIENFILIVIPGIIGYVYRMRELKRLYKHVDYYNLSFHQIHNTYIPFVLMIAGIIMLISSVIIPALLIRNLKPIELLGGKND